MSEAKQKRRHCRWKQDPYHGYWSTGCGREWCFNDDAGPTENGAKYCMGCGKPIRVVGKVTTDECRGIIES